MIKQDIKYYKFSNIIEDYKEYFDGELIIHTKYDINSNKIYGYFKEGNLEYNREFDEGCKDDCGMIIYYKDNKGNFTNLDKITGIHYNIKMDTNVFEIKIRLDNRVLFFANGFNDKDENGYLYLLSFIEKQYNYCEINYNCMSFEEIYFNNSVNHERNIISYETLMDLTQFKDFFDEHKISIVTKRYKKESNEFRTFNPNNLVD